MIIKMRVNVNRHFVIFALLDNLWLYNNLDAGNETKRKNWAKKSIWVERSEERALD